MKKNLLLAAVVLPLMSVSAQWTQVGGLVKVEPNTLKYVKQDYKVSGNSTTKNQGWVNVRGNFTTEGTNELNEGPSAAKGFHNIWTGRNDYGQLIINQTSPVAGTIENQYNIPPNLAFISMAFPFEDYTATKAASDAGIDNPTFDTYAPDDGNDGFMPGRYNNTVWTWSNVTSGDEGEFYFDDYNANETNVTLPPHLYHGLNNMDGTVSGTEGFIGVPANSEKYLNVVPYSITNSGDVNNVGELYGSYVEDVAVNEPTNWRAIVDTGDTSNDPNDGVDAGDYGSNIALFGNPYTSNIDLSGKLDGITHLWIINNNSYEGDVEGLSNDSNVKVATVTQAGEFGGSVSGFATGDADLFKMRPQQTFFLKGGNAVTNITLDESVKTFSAKDGTFIETSRTNNDNGFYQATLKLYNSEGNYANNETYVFASDVIEPNTVSRYEAYNNNFGDLGFYSLQENADGTIDAELADATVLINGVNATDYVAKPINLVFKGDGEFTVKGELTQNLIQSGNTFYFEDRQTGDVIEVTPEFEYTFTNNGTASDRFFMYWNGMPDVMAVDDVTLISQTKVYKNNNDFSIRFADEWIKADVYVYNVLGQLVHTAKGIDANNDYLLPLNGNASAYIVKTVGDNGEIATQKIVKK